MKTSYYKNLIVKDLSNNINEEEKRLLLDWQKKSDKNKIEYEKLKSVWVSSLPNKLEFELNIDDEWECLSNNIISKIDSPNKSRNPISSFIGSLFAPKFRPAWAMGSILAIIISSFLFLNNNEPHQILNTISTSNNQRLEVKLSDGSIVQLNSGSEIQFYENFEEDKREIKLKGEAFFSVIKDGRPFIISTQNATTKVLGTKFNVWSREKETRVLVKEGKVSLANNTILKDEVILTKGEISKIIESESPESPEKVDPEYMLGWLNKTLVFNNTPLLEIAEELERFYDVKINVESSELNRINLTGSFNNEEIDSVLAKICLALNINYEQNNNIYNITN